MPAEIKRVNQKNMMDKYTLIEKFRAGQLTPNEQKQFNQLIETDAEFQEDLKEHLKMSTALDILVEEDVKAYINSLDVKKPKVRRLNMRWASIAASLLLLVTAGYFTFLSPQLSGPEISDKYFAETVDERVRSDGTSEPLSDWDRKIKAAYKLADDENYEEALKAYKELTTGNHKYRDQAIYNVALLTLHFDLEAGEKLLKEVSNDPNNKYNQRAKSALKEF